MRLVLDALPSEPASRQTYGDQTAHQAYLPLPTNRQRVAIIAPSASALVGSCHGMILDMVNRGHRVFALAPNLTNKDFRVLSHIGAEAFALPVAMETMERYRRLRELAVLLGDIDPHVALIQSAKDGAVAVTAAKMAKVPHVVTVVPSLGPSFMEGARTGAWADRQAMKAVYRTIFSLSDAVVFHSAHDQKYAHGFKLISKKKPQLLVGGWGEDMNRNFQKPLPPIDRGVLFIMVAPIERNQGVLEFIQAAKIMRLKARRARFFLASNAGETVAPAMVAELKAHREYVQYIGPTADPASVIAKCHVAVAPSYGDGTPRALFQALALGRPAITTDTRSCRDFVQQGLNGYRVPVRDAEGLARGMTQMLQRPDQMPLMAEESRRIALRFFEINAVNALVFEALGL